MALPLDGSSKSYENTRLANNATAHLGDTHNNTSVSIRKATIVVSRDAGRIKKYTRRIVTLKQRVKALEDELLSKQAVDRHDGDGTRRSEGAPSDELQQMPYLIAVAEAIIMAADRVLDMEREVTETLKSQYEKDVQDLKEKLHVAEAQNLATQADLDEANLELEKAKQTVREAQDLYDAYQKTDFEHQPVDTEDIGNKRLEKRVSELEQDLQNQNLEHIEIHRQLLQSRENETQLSNQMQDLEARRAALQTELDDSRNQLHQSFEREQHARREAYERLQDLEVRIQQTVGQHAGHRGVERMDVVKLQEKNTKYKQRLRELKRQIRQREGRRECVCM